MEAVPPEALESQGQFQQFVQSLVPRDVPPDVVFIIKWAVQEVLGEAAYIELQGSARKHTNVEPFSDHDYHIKMPSRCPVTRSQMEDIAEQMKTCLGPEPSLEDLSLEANMTQTALKVKYCQYYVCGSIDLVPLNGNYFESWVVVEPADRDFYKNIRRQNAARALKYVAGFSNWDVKSYDLERAVVKLDQEVPISEDPHGLLLFKVAMIPLSCTLKVRC